MPVTCMNDKCTGHTPSATWYCSGWCQVEHERTEALRERLQQPPQPVALTTGLRARLGV